MGRHGVETVLGGIVLLVVGMFMFFAYSAAQVKAVVVMLIVADIKLPTDTVASIGSEGIVGSKYVRFEPGVEKTFIEAGGEIALLPVCPSLKYIHLWTDLYCRYD